jgi:rRNA maturation RNase YbeY
MGERLLETVDRGNAFVSVYLTDDVEIHRMNRRFRHVDRPTDVLSFPTGEEKTPDMDLGEIVISVETASRQASEKNESLMERLVDLLAHGILHLLGFDHHGTKKSSWDREQRRLRSAQKALKNSLRAALKSGSVAES